MTKTFDRSSPVKITELPRPPGKVPSVGRLWNPTPSTPLWAGSNVERRDVRMGHLAVKTIGKILYLRIEEVLYLKTRDLELMY